MHAQRFGIVGLEAPLPLGRFRLNALAPKVAMMDLGLTWLFGRLARMEQAAPKRHKRPRQRPSRRAKKPRP